MRGCFEAVSCFFQAIGIVACVIVAVAAIVITTVAVERQPVSYQYQPAQAQSISQIQTRQPATLEPTATPWPTATPAPSEPVTIVSAQLHHGPGTDTPIMGAIHAETSLHITGVLDGGSWYQLISGHWIEARHVANPPLGVQVLVIETIEAPALIQAEVEPALIVSRLQQKEPVPTPIPPTPTQVPPTPVPAITLVPPMVFQPVEPAPVAPFQPPEQVTCDCSGNVYNCSDFDSHNTAMACFQYCLSTTGRDIHGLDGDGDGLVCESRG